MEIVRFINSPYNSNCYVISNNQISIVVDPCFETVSQIDDFCLAQKTCLKYIIITHEHYDHISGCNFIRKKYPDVKLICSESCSKNIQNPKMNLSAYAFDNGIGFCVDLAEIILCDDITKLTFADLDIVFMLTPGHSEGSLCFWINNIFFSGDTVIPGYKTVTKLRGGSKEQFDVSCGLLQRVIRPGTILYPGHLDSIIINRLEEYD